MRYGERRRKRERETEMEEYPDYMYIKPIAWHGYCPVVALPLTICLDFILIVSTTVPYLFSKSRIVQISS